VVYREWTGIGGRPKLQALSFLGWIPPKDRMSLWGIGSVLVYLEGGSRDLAQTPGPDEGFFGAIYLNRRSFWVDQSALSLQERETAHMVEMSVCEQQQLKMFGQHIQHRAMTEGAVA
jgi:hypothetical protein